MKLELSEDERKFFEQLIQVHDSPEALEEYGITEDDLRLVKMKAEDQSQDIDVEEIVESLTRKNVLEKQSVKKKSGGLSKDNNDDSLHKTASREVEKYSIINQEVLDELLNGMAD